MAALTRQQKVFVVERLASFQTPTEVVQAVAETFNVTVTRQQLQRYDPSTVNGADLAPELKKLFEKTRERYLQETGDIAIAHQAYRLRELNELYSRAKQSRNYVLAAAHLEQASKEIGGVFTSRREVSGRGGGAVELEVQFRGWSLEEMDAFALAGPAGLAALRRGQDPRELVVADLEREKARAVC